MEALRTTLVQSGYVTGKTASRVGGQDSLHYQAIQSEHHFFPSKDFCEPLPGTGTTYRDRAPEPQHLSEQDFISDHSF